MTVTEELMQAALAAPDRRKNEALRVLKGEASVQAAPAAAPQPGQVEKYLTLSECARRLGMSACSLWRWQVPGHELGGRPKFKLSEVEAYLASDKFRKLAQQLKRDRQAALKVKCAASGTEVL